MTTTRAVLASAALVLVSAILAPAVRGQALRNPRWTLTAAAEWLRAGDRSWGYGPAIAIRHDFGPRWGAELKAALPAFGSSNAGGAAIELGATITTFEGATEFGAMLGLTAFLVGDNSEFTGGGGGVVLAAHVTRWLAPGLGLTAGGNIRAAEGVFPALYAGFAARF